MSEIKIETAVSDEIFEGIVLKSNLDKLLEKEKEKIEGKISKILQYLELQQTEEFSYEKILPIFKERFCTQIANEAVKRAFISQRSHDVYDGLLYLTSEDRMEKAINGDILLNIIQDILREYLPEAKKKETLRNSEMLRSIGKINID